MKNRILLLALFLTFASPLYAEKNASKDRPYIPMPQSRTTAVVAGVATAHNSAFLNDSVLAPSLMFSSSQPTYALNHIKGDLGELMMNRVFTSSVLKHTGGWGILTPTAVGRNGIDGLYIKMDSLGNPRSLLVADAKVNSAQLGYTKTGKQMSRQWIAPRLSRTADSYRKLSASLSDSKTRLIRSKSIPKRIILSKQINVQINDKASAVLWKTPKGYAFFSHDPGVTSEQVRRQIAATANYLQSAADGNIAYRSRLFTYKAEAGKHVIAIKNLDANGNVVSSGKPIKGTFEQLPVEYRRAIRHAAIRTLGEQRNVYGLPKYSKSTLKKMVEQCCEDPEYFNKVCTQPKVMPSSVRIAVTIGTATVVAGGLDALTQYLTTGEINWRQTGTIALLSGTSTAVGLAASSGLQALGCSTAMSSLGGGSIAGALMAYGMYAMGYCSLGQANLNAATSLAATGAIVATPAVMAAIAVTWGTTSTGVAISSLSGAAMTNAILAWWGGGAIAAGGGGMAAGGTAIAFATGGIAVVVLAIPAVYMTYKHFADSAQQHRYLQGMIDIVSDRVHRGDQIEWSNLQLAPR